MDSDGDLLFRAEVAFGGLDGAVSEQELDLFQIAASLAAEFGAGTAEIMGAERSMPICFADCSTNDQTAYPLSASSTIVPPLRTDWKSRRSSIVAAAISR